MDRWLSSDDVEVMVLFFSIRYWKLINFFISDIQRSFCNILMRRSFVLRPTPTFNLICMTLNTGIELNASKYVYQICKPLNSGI